MRQNETVKNQRELLKEMGADRNDPRAKALDRIEAKQAYECVTHTEKDE